MELDINTRVATLLDQLESEHLSLEDIASIEKKLEILNDQRKFDI